MNSNEQTLTIIIPVRASENRTDILERLDFPRADDRIPPEVGFFVVDDGSPRNISAEIEKKCQANGFRYLRTETELDPICNSRSRNVGAMNCTSEYILFQDLDLVPYPGFYRDALNEIRVQRLDLNSELFAMFGVIYLSEAATREFFATPAELRKEIFLQRLLAGDRDSIVKVSTGTSVTIFNREYYLTRGGNSEDFYEWGYEDLEFICRCMRQSGVFPLPADFAADYRSFETICEYRGWKAPYRLFGDMTFMKGKVLFHAWHPVDRNSDYQKGRKRNQDLFNAKLDAFRKRGAASEPDPLPSLCEGRTLLFSNTNPFVYNRATLSKLGRVFVEDEDAFTTKTLLQYLQRNEITRVLFHNPYANPHRLKLYRALRRAKFPYVVAERGALPDSVFFDPGGFLADSNSYSEEKWNYPLTPEREAAIADYVRDERAGDQTLEGQGARIGVAALRKKLKLKPHQKVLFVALQRPGDTVIKFQSGSIGTFDNFIKLAAEVRERLGSDWAVVYKKHPLEDVTPDIPGAIDVEDAHIKDLLPLADMVLLINSGVGVLSMIWQTPVLYAGAAWYGHPSINRHVQNADDVLAAIEQGFEPDREATMRFLAYLVFDFYSFGKFTTREVDWTDGGRMTVTSAIDFYQIRGLGRSRFNSRKEKAPLIGHESILFDRYRHALTSHTPVPTPLATRAKPAIAAPARPAAPSELKPPASPATAPPPAALQAKRINGKPAQDEGLATQLDSYARKLRKLRESPSRFFAESKHRPLRAIGVLYSKN